MTKLSNIELNQAAEAVQYNYLTKHEASWSKNPFKAFGFFDRANPGLTDLLSKADAESRDKLVGIMVNNKASEEMFTKLGITPEERAAVKVAPAKPGFFSRLLSNIGYYTNISWLFGKPTFIGNLFGKVEAKKEEVKVEAKKEEVKVEAKKEEVKSLEEALTIAKEANRKALNQLEKDQNTKDRIKTSFGDIKTEVETLQNNKAEAEKVQLKAKEVLELAEEKATEAETKVSELNSKLEANKEQIKAAKEEISGFKSERSQSTDSAEKEKLDVKIKSKELIVTELQSSQTALAAELNGVTTAASELTLSDTTQQIQPNSTTGAKAEAKVAREAANKASRNYEAATRTVTNIDEALTRAVTKKDKLSKDLVEAKNNLTKARTEVETSNTQLEKAVSEFNISKIDKIAAKAIADHVKAQDTIKSNLERLKSDLPLVNNKPDYKKKSDMFKVYGEHTKSLLDTATKENLTKENLETSNYFMAK